LLPDIADNLLFRDNKNGYSPLYGQIDLTKYTPLSENNQMITDSLKLSYVEKLIILCRDNEIPLVFMISPRFKYSNSLSQYEPALNMCEKQGIPVFNYLNDSAFVSHPEFFQDEGHLNHNGAIHYTQKIIEEVIKDNLIL